MAELLHKAMVYLGLADDEFEEYDPQYDNDEYSDEYQQPSPQPTQQRVRTQPTVDLTDSGVGAIRTLPREERSGVGQPQRSAVVRPIVTTTSSKVHVVDPQSFAEAQEIGDRLRANQPVIISLQDTSAELSRRLIDFCSGATYVIGGTMERVAKNVFLLAPSNVEVSAEERRKLQERGYRS
jgi:cell division inhibitor SepF